MGDDAEYYIEQQEEELSSRLAYEHSLQDRNKKVLLCWSGKCRHELWEWEPLSKVLNVFSDLYHLRKIGSDYFLACNVPIEDYEEDYDYSANRSKSVHGINKKIVDDLEFDVVDNENEATYEVIVISRHDTALLKKEANRQNNLAKSLKEVMLAEMIVEIAEFVESNSMQNMFVFAREL